MPTAMAAIVGFADIEDNTISGSFNVNGNGNGGPG